MGSLYVLIKSHSSGPPPGSKLGRPWGQAAPHGLMRQEREAPIKRARLVWVESEHRGGTRNPATLALSRMGLCGFRIAANRDSVNYRGFTSVPVNVNVPSAVPPPSRGSPWSGKLVSLMVPATFVRSELNVKV